MQFCGIRLIIGCPKDGWTGLCLSLCFTPSMVCNSVNCSIDNTCNDVTSDNFVLEF